MQSRLREPTDYASPVPLEYQWSHRIEPLCVARSIFEVRIPLALHPFRMGFVRTASGTELRPMTLRSKHRFAPWAYFLREAGPLRHALLGAVRCVPRSTRRERAPARW